MLGFATRLQSSWVAAIGLVASLAITSRALRLDVYPSWSEALDSIGRSGEKGEAVVGHATPSGEERD